MFKKNILITINLINFINFKNYILKIIPIVFRIIVDRMKKIASLNFLVFFSIFIVSCAAENKNKANLPKIDGFEVKKIFRLNRSILVAYMDSSGNRLVFKLNENSATWKRILFKTKVSFKH